MRTLDPGAGYSTSAETTFDALTLSDSVWRGHTLSLPITGALDGHILQFGFFNESSDFNDTGVYYDNINLVVPEPATFFLTGLGVLSLIGFHRRK